MSKKMREMNKFRSMMLQRYRRSDLCSKERWSSSKIQFKKNRNSAKDLLQI